MLTIQKIAQALPNARISNIELYFPHLVEAMKKFGILHTRSIAAFLAQCAHESALFSRVVENLNYSAEGLLNTFPRYFNTSEAQQYARKPERIANRVYANRMGNGPESSGDGWTYRGRGLIQLTGKNNYIALSKDLDIDVVKNPSYLETPEGASRSAAWFWRKNNLNAPAIRGDIDEVSRIVNAGPAGSLRSVHGLTERRNYYNRILSTLESNRSN